MNQPPVAEKPYRPNAGTIVFNGSAQVLVGERLNYRGAWQFPQGGIDDGEDPRAAAIRELYEEVGLQLEPIAEVADWLYYDFPPDIPDKLKKFKGQKQRWFLFFWQGDPASLDLEIHEREFASVRWMDFAEVVQQIVPFKQSVYQELQAKAQPLIKNFLRQVQ